MQLNQILLPVTEHLAQACSTKERGMSTTSSISTPARVTPWISDCEPSSFPPNSQKLLRRPL